MDLIGINNQLKQMSDQQLAQSLHDPSVPPYLVISEMNQRNQMRQAFQQNQQAPNQPSVAQSVMGRFAQGMQQQQRPPMPGPNPMQYSGIMGAMGQPQQPMGGFSRPNIPSSVPGIHMAQGGAVRMDSGGDTTEAIPDLSALVPTDQSMQGLPITLEDYRKIYPAPNPADAQKWIDVMRGMEGADRITPVAQKIALLEEQMRNAKPENGLLAFALGMGASRNPSFAGAVAEGGLGALQRYDAQKQKNQEMAMGLLGAQSELARAQQQREEQRLHNALGAWEKQMAEQNVMESEIGANVRARLNAIQTGKLKVADLQQRYREALMKLNVKYDPDAPAKFAWTANYDPDPERRKAAKGALADIQAYEAAIKSASARGNGMNMIEPGTPKLPGGWTIDPSTGKTIPPNLTGGKQ